MMISSDSDPGRIRLRFASVRSHVLSSVQSLDNVVGSYVLKTLLLANYMESHTYRSYINRPGSTFPPRRICLEIGSTLWHNLEVVGCFTVSSRQRGVLESSLVIGCYGGRNRF